MRIVVSTFHIGVAVGIALSLPLWAAIIGWCRWIYLLLSAPG